MRCQEVKELLSGYIDGQLDDACRKEVSAHLDECEECCKELAELQKAVSLMRHAPEISPPSQFKNNLISQVHKDKAKEPGGPGKFLRRHRAAAAAAAAVICLTVGFSIWNSHVGFQKTNLSQTEDKAGMPAKQRSLNEKEMPAAEKDKNMKIQSFSVTEEENNREKAEDKSPEVGDRPSLLSKPQNTAGIASEAGNELNFTIVVEKLEETREKIKKAVKEYEGNLKIDDKKIMKITVSKEYYRDLTARLLSFGEVINEKCDGIDNNSIEIKISLRDVNK
ncbi:MAG: zf-HC2 domain-containing protein [Clostridiales bacterium]|nr:zf-HC2 domain-containing protein [Clostridiales bacterium]MCF8023064.1 zf-HC2 domain-containing protein [Clostridiales bacterium]